MLRLINKQDLDKIRNWRNAPNVRENMFTDHLISPEEHLAWWQKIGDNASRKVLMFVRNGIDEGVVLFFDIDRRKQSCHWGFYLSNVLNEMKTRINTWQSLEKEAIDYAFSELRCKQIFCETFSFNKPVLEMHKRFGFVESAIKSRKKGNSNEDVVLSTLTAEKYYDKKPIDDTVNNPILHASDADTASIESEPSFTRFTTRCVLMGSSNLDFLKSSLNRYAKHYAIDLQLTDIPYGQYQIAVNDPNNLVYSSTYDYVIFIETIDNLIPINEVLDSSILDDLIKRWNDYLNVIKQYRSLLTGTFLIGNVVSMNRWITGYDPTNDENTTIGLALEEMQQQLNDLCSEISESYIIDLSKLIWDVGINNAHPEKYWYLARAPFSYTFNEHLSENLIATLMALEDYTARVIVLDLDNTLWQGAIGDDGMNGIIVDGDYPGNVYQSIQNTLLTYKKRGLLLTVCSKNNEDTALEAINQHPGMQLSSTDLTSWRINWLPKPQNIIALADELGLSVSTFCMLDDNPMERAEIRSSLPEMFVPELPAEISKWPEFIKRLPEFADISISEEDKKRSHQYKTRAEINNNYLTTDDRINFLKSLELKISFELYNNTNQQRILQLISKTNQFNTTTRRYKKSEVELFNISGICHAIRLRDRLGSNEIIGVLMVKFEKQESIIDTFLLSCRVLGRGIETAVMAWLCIYSNRNNIKIIKGEMIPTERNEPVLSLYKQLQFKKTGSFMFEFDLSNNTIDIPSWIILE